MSGIEGLIQRANTQGSRSPARSASPTTSEELGGEDDYNASIGSKTALTEAHDGPNTGVKGVRADAAWHANEEKAKRSDAVRATNKRMESMALGKNRTWDVEEAQRREERAAGVTIGQSTAKAYAQDDEDDDELESIRMRRLQSLKSRRKRLAGEFDGNTDAKQSQHFGHLREVGHGQYVQAIDNESKSTFVIVHIYVKYVQACAMLTSALSSIARMNPSVKFIQIRAGCIGFGSGGLNDVDTEDIDEDTLDEKAEDVVPTLLVYRNAAIVANLVRVDLDPRWGDGSERYIQDLLKDVGAIS